jgi:hypothetical protein
MTDRISTLIRWVKKKRNFIYKKLINLTNQLTNYPIKHNR